jgi:hypothetical protein
MVSKMDLKSEVNSGQIDSTTKLKKNVKEEEKVPQIPKGT